MDEICAFNGSQKSQTQKKISKRVYRSPALKQLIEHAVRNKHVRKEMCATWIESFSEEQEHALLKLKAEANNNPSLFMKLGDHYSKGLSSEGSQDLQTAYMFYEKGWTLTSDKTFFIRMTMLNTLRSEQPKIASYVLGRVYVSWTITKWRHTW